MKFLNEHLEACFIVPLMFLMSIIIFVQVVMRYVFHSSLTWSEEMARVKIKPVTSPRSQHNLHRSFQRHVLT